MMTEIAGSEAVGIIEDYILIRKDYWLLPE
jgi:hypothetical protein